MKIICKLISIILFISIVYACNISIPTPTGHTPIESIIPKTATPEASLRTGNYIGTINVELTSSEPSAKIYYTLDGSDPSEVNGILYNSSIIIDFDCTLKAIAYLGDYFPSDVLIENYYFPPLTYGRVYRFIDGKLILSPYYALGNEVHILPMEKKYPGDNTTPFASTIFAKIIDNNVYLYGSYNNGYETIPCYWVNDKLIKLPRYTDSDWGECNDVYIKDGIVYAVGLSADSGLVRYYPCLWVNENLTVLSTENHVDAKKIFYNEDDQYILCSGFQNAYYTNSLNYYLKNGIRYDIPSIANDEFIYDISIINNQVILLGTKYEHPSPNIVYSKPFFIINNEKHYFDLNGNLSVQDINYKFFQIYIIDNHFYFISNVISSFYPDGTPTAIIPYIWKDGEYIPNGIDPNIKIAYTGSKNNIMYIIDILNKSILSYSSNADFSLPNWKTLSLPSSEYLQHKEGVIF